VVDAVVDTDRVEQHRTRALREPGGEDAAIVGEHLAGKAMGAKRELAGCTDRPGGRPHHQPGRDAVAGVVIDPGQAFELGAVFEVEAADEVELPQLHGSRALPALVVLLRRQRFRGVMSPWRARAR